jgi:hypothetical protein
MTEEPEDRTGPVLLLLLWVAITIGALNLFLAFEYPKPMSLDRVLTPAEIQER